MDMTIPLYDQFSSDYDRFVNWERRLANELPFVEAQLDEMKAQRVLDAACGTGRHAIALAKRGYSVVGVDPSRGMIERARQAAEGHRGKLDLQFAVAGFGEFQDALHDGAVPGGFDAVLCLGSSLPHVLTREGLATALSDFGAVLRPGGLLLIQNRNFDMVLAKRERWMKPQSHTEGENEWVFVRVYDFDDDGTITFNVLTLRREGSSAWQQSVEATQLYPWRQETLLAALDEGKWGNVVCWGDMRGGAYVPAKSPNLVIAATAGIVAQSRD
jgi:SAM-dependent methyltransferase